MANLARAALTQVNATTSDATSLVSASITVTSGRRVLLGLFHTHGNPTPASPTPTGASITNVTLVGTVTNSAGTIRGTVWLAEGTGSSGAVTWDWGADTQTGFWAVIGEWAGDNLPTLRNVGGTDQVATASGTGTSGPITLPAAVGGAGNGYAVVAIVGKATTGAYTGDSGFTVVNDTGFTGPTLRAMQEFDIGPGGNGVAPSWTSSGTWCGIILELTDEATGANITGAAALSGTGDLAAAGQREAIAAAALSGAGALTAAGQREALGAAALSGVGDLTAAGLRDVLGQALLAGSGTLTAAGLRDARGAALLSGVGALSARGRIDVDVPTLLPPLRAVVLNDGTTFARIANDGTTSVEVTGG